VQPSPRALATQRGPGGWKLRSRYILDEGGENTAQPPEAAKPASSLINSRRRMLRLRSYRQRIVPAKTSAGNGDVRFGSKADMCRHVRFTPETGHRSCHSDVH